MRPTRYGGILRATRPALDPDALQARITALRGAVETGDPVVASDALWATLRAGRDDAAIGETGDVHSGDQGDDR